MHNLQDVYKDDKIKLFHDLQNSFALPSSELFTYMRISHCIRATNIPPNAYIPLSNAQYYTTPKYLGNGLYHFYSYLTNLEFPFLEQMGIDHQPKCS